jgi:hypothetical protein
MHGMSAAAPVAPGQFIGQSPVGEYSPASQRVSTRAGSIKPLAIVTLVLGGLGLLVVLGIALLFSALSMFATGVLILLAVVCVPIVAGILLLTSKSVLLVKVILILMLINYSISMLDLIYSLIQAHGRTNPASFIVSIVFALAFSWWTWSVLSDVNSLAA